MILGNINTFKNCNLSSDTLMSCIEFLRTVSKDTPNGRYELDNGVYYMVMDASLSSAEGKLFEAHRKYTDVQYILDGEETMIYTDVTPLTESVPYNPDKDIVFFECKGGFTFTVKAGEFAVFTPTDAHAPGIGVGTAKKVVMKIPASNN